MSGETSEGSDLASLQVCVRVGCTNFKRCIGYDVNYPVRPLFDRERTAGCRVCVHYDDPTKQVVLTAVDRSTLVQLRGSTAKGYSFDRYYGVESVSDEIYDDCVGKLIENCFRGYNGTVLAYGQTGSGKTHTMAGGVGIHGVQEEGVIPRVIRHVFQVTDQLSRRAKPGEGIEITASAIEIYNEELKDLSKSADGTKMKIVERNTGQGRMATEVQGLREYKFTTANDLFEFFEQCNECRSVGSTKLNDRSSRSHAIFTIGINRTVVEITDELDENFKAKVSTESVCSKLHLVDLAGSERVKRSGAVGQQLKEASHINGGLLALGNVIVALSKQAEKKEKGHVPYRDSKLTRLLQDSLGGNSLTVLVTCISSSEGDFEETNNTLKYANRACKIKNTPLPNKYVMLEEDLLPVAPAGADGQFGMAQLASLLEQHARMKEVREKRSKEKEEKEAKRREMLEQARESEMKTPGYQRLRAQEYDRLRKERARGRTGFSMNESIGGDTLLGFGRRDAQSLTEASESDSRSSTARRTYKSRSSYLKSSKNRSSSRRHRHTRSAGSASVSAPNQPVDFSAWLSSQGPEASSVQSEPVEEESTDMSTAASESSTTSHSRLPNRFGKPAGIVALQNRKDRRKRDMRRGEDVGREEGQEEGPSEEDDPNDEDEESNDASPPLRTLSRNRSVNKMAKAPADDDPSRTQSTDSIKVGWNVEEDDGESRRSGHSEFTDIAEECESFANDDEVDLEEESPEYRAMDNMFSERPLLLARFKINKDDVISIFKACSKEDYKDVMSLLPENTPLPASDKMTYLIARLEIRKDLDIDSAIEQVAAGQAELNQTIGPAVGCLMATYGTNMISSCIFDFDDPVQLFDVDERIELWGLQIPHNSARPTVEDLQAQAAAAGEEDSVEGSKSESNESSDKENTIVWSSVDRLNMSVGLLYALCNHASRNDVRCGFCVPRPQLLRRWAQAGVSIKEITTPMKLIYPSHAHDYEYYKSSTVAYFMVDEVQIGLTNRLALI